MIVVDVDVIAYLLIAGEGTAESEAVLGRDPEWAAPLLWHSEWRNVLGCYLRRGDLDRREARERLETAEALVRGREYLVESSHVLDLIASSSCSAYDCEYVALAETLRVPLVTNDRRVLTDFSEPAISPGDFVSSRA